MSRIHSQSIARGVRFSHDAPGVRVVSVNILRGDISSIFFGAISRRYFSGDFSLVSGVLSVGRGETTVDLGDGAGGYNSHP